MAWVWLAILFGSLLSAAVFDSLVRRNLRKSARPRIPSPLICQEDICPGCGIQIPELRKQIDHMGTCHPDIVNSRLQEAGFVRDSKGEWVDPYGTD